MANDGSWSASGGPLDRSGPALDHAALQALRSVYEDRRERARDLFTTELATLLDASTTHPIDVVAEYEARLRALSVPPEQIAARTERWWHTLRIGGAVPRRILPTTTWTRLLRDAERPPTWVLEGAWQQLVHGRGFVLWEALQRLVQAAREADSALEAWVQASEIARGGHAGGAGGAEACHRPRAGSPPGG